tara:strand:+ start:70 stop:567 length:498 start_codon:yes stop_codon:yes gene_type:complete
VSLAHPNEDIKKEIYELYKAVYKCSLKKNHKIKILRNIFTYEPWSWRVVGISKKALREFAKNNFNYKTGTFNRDHCFQPAVTTMKEMLKKFMSYEEWWTWFWNNDKTVLVTITEHNKKSYKFKDDIIPIDWKLGYFQCAEAIGFKYRKKNEGKFLERLAEEYNIK